LGELDHGIRSHPYGFASVVHAVQAHALVRLQKPRTNVKRGWAAVNDSNRYIVHP
jgi:hypothetical protein